MTPSDLVMSLTLTDLRQRVLDLSQRYAARVRGPEGSDEELRHELEIAQCLVREAEMIYEARDLKFSMPKGHLTYVYGDRVKKRSGGSWHGDVVGYYRTALTPEGYVVESAYEPGSVQLYPVSALETWDGR